MLHFLYIEAYVRLDDVPDMISFRHATVAAWNEREAYDPQRGHETFENHHRANGGHTFNGRAIDRCPVVPILGETIVTC